MIVTVGRIGRAHGVRGEVTVEVRTDVPDERFEAGATLRTEPATTGPLTVRRARWHSGRLLVSFDAVTDRDAAEALRGTVLLAEISADEHPDDPDEFHDHQLVGLRVVTTGGEHVGTVDDVLHTPGQDVLAVHREDGGEVLVPFVREIVPDVDLSGATVVIDPPAGLLDLDGDGVGARSRGERRTPPEAAR